MITVKMIEDSKAQLLENWEADGEKVIAECAKFPSLNIASDEFLTHCTACGGNWGGMFLTGIHELRPTVWDAIPDDMGVFAFGCICAVLILCGVDTSER